MFTLESLRTRLAEDDKFKDKAEIAVKKAAPKALHVLYDFDQEYIKEMEGVVPKSSELLMYRSFWEKDTLIIPHDLNIMGHPKVLKIYKKNLKLDFNLKIASYAIKYVVAVLDEDRLLSTLAYFLKQLYSLVPKYQINHPDNFLHWRFRSEAQILSQDKCLDQTKYQTDEYWVIFNSRLMEEFTSVTDDEEKDFAVQKVEPESFNYKSLNKNLFADYVALKDEKNYAEWAFNLLEIIQESGLDQSSETVAQYVRNIWLIVCLIPKTIERASREIPVRHLTSNASKHSEKYNKPSKRVISTMLRSLFIMEYDAYIHKGQPPVMTLEEANRLQTINNIHDISYTFYSKLRSAVVHPKEKCFYPAGGVSYAWFKKNLALLTGNLFETIDLSEYGAYLSGSMFFACAYNHTNPGNYRKIESYLIDRYNDVDLDIMVNNAENLARLVAKLRASYPGKLNIRGANAQHVEFYAELPSKTLKIDMFLYEHSPAYMVSRFHLGCVRGYWDGKEAYVLPSFITTQMLRWSPDIRSTFNIKLVQILDKYYGRGVGFLLNNLELKEMAKYTQITNHQAIFKDRNLADKSTMIWRKLRDDKIITVKSLHKKLKAI
nr:hypothetical protein K-LCC10_0051 [Kaumoebavirus]